ncbi:hypothetical protein MNVM_42150 [Mycobacterium novum]|uniref:HTH tetR-type domain-containing protein n=1 Tax=Mycobacterium novum TaxID=2492438 RepID=A0A7I7JV66_9MYCO|nr:hypothetical protein MNVM_42150 [Mycobacterium novum]
MSSARELFAHNGFQNTSIRAVAADAGVDAALVHHYYGTKQQLFAAATELPVDPMVVLGPLRDAPVEQLGRILPELLLPLWDSQAGTGLIAAMRSMLTGTEVPLARSFSAISWSPNSPVASMYRPEPACCAPSSPRAS